MNNKVGKFVISIDTELAWGTQDLGLYKNYKKHFDLTRHTIQEAINLFNKYEISATWAIVGHLFLDQCSEVEGHKHAEILRPQYEWVEHDWFENDPCTNLKDQPHWYGKDIVQLIQESSVHQEIGSHSFSHFIFGHESCTAKIADSDLQAAVSVAKEQGITLSSFVFPRNSEGNHEMLIKHKFICYRGKTIHWYDKFPKYTGRLLHFLDQLFALTPKTNSAYYDPIGLVNIPDSMFLMPHDGLRKLIPNQSRVNKAKKGIDRAIERGEVFHLWFHPFNLASNPHKMLSALNEILKYASIKINEGLLINLTMEELAKETRK